MSRNIDDFREIAGSTAGMMQPETYLALYELACSRSDGDIIDVGVGQGATTIAFALGIRDSGSRGQVLAVDQFYQVSHKGPHRYNQRDHPKDCVELNLGVFESHLERYDVAHLVTTYSGTTDEVATIFPSEVNCSLLSIDVDGHIDRDLSHFYDVVQTGGRIVIDDCRNAVNRQGRTNIDKMQGRRPDEIEAWIAGRHALTTGPRRLLGKHLLTYRLARYFESVGALAQERAIGTSTMVFTKTGTRPFAELPLGGIGAVEQSIVDDFVAACV